MFKVTQVNNKSADWKVISVVNSDGDEVHEVSVNRTNKKGEVFPDFDKIIVGADIQGQSWVSQTGKKYLFPPKQTKQNLNNDLLQNIANTLVAHRLILEDIRAAVIPKTKTSAFGGAVEYPQEDITPEDVPF